MRRLLGAALLVLTACASAPPDPATFFEGRRTYAWLPGRPFTADIRADNEFVRERITAAVSAALEARGYRPAGVDDADILIAAYALVGKVSVRPRPTESNEGYKAAPGARMVGEEGAAPVYEAGALVLDVVDPIWKTLMWRGGVKGNLRLDVEPVERDARVRAAAAKVVALLPPPAP
jgi:hypothetical protein